VHRKLGDLVGFWKLAVEVGGGDFFMALLQWL
jgi:hypothetical protein